jgi:hypothetical protein
MLIAAASIDGCVRFVKTISVREGNDIASAATGAAA